ncbi:nucleotide exchange factor GrpE [Hyphomonas sp.]|jgi:molecular chaperone GrpE|uniref:nucleotide exchange factor GrpE n=1 Tax=Hyphomonas sp. TaxID=87 RepID=UPI0032D936CF
MSDETKPGETAEIDSTASKADLKAAADDLLKSAPKAADEPAPDLDPVQQLEIEKEELREQLLRTLADLDNTRKRAERQVADARIYAIEKFAGDLLSVSDNLSRALAALTDDDRAALSEAGRNLFEGIEMTEKELHTALARHGVTVIAALPGDTFDPNLHQAVANIPSDQPNGTIASCFQPGWKIGERTLRAAMVAVSAGAAN